MEVNAKRLKLEQTFDNALNLSLSASKRECQSSEPIERNFEDHVQEMRSKFQRWVIETYRDASKTKTITAKKYERIVKTLVGEIKNCAENSKFRFWMKCKGFKLDSNQTGGPKSLLVLDRKGDEIKYKKVAVVENFFDIIYDVHVNEGARGIKHAGQKRTHRTITETYAFLPREAVTKFLMCCSDCQKRTSHEDRKFSPTSSSGDSVHPTSCERCDFFSVAENQNFLFPYSSSAHDCTCDNATASQTTISTENNNNSVNLNHAADVLNFTIPNSTSSVDKCSTELDSARQNVRKRKREITRKIVRPSDEFERADRNGDTSEKVFEFCLPESTFNTSHSMGVQEGPSTITYPSEDQVHDVKSSESQDNKHFPYVAKICDVLYDPMKYAMLSERPGDPILNDDFLEETAARVLLKARRLESGAELLTENERQQLSIEIYSCRIISFLMNYAADLMLKSVVAERKMDFGL